MCVFVFEKFFGVSIFLDFPFFVFPHADLFSSFFVFVCQGGCADFYLLWTQMHRDHEGTPRFKSHLVVSTPHTVTFIQVCAKQKEKNTKNMKQTNTGFKKLERPASPFH